MAMDYSDYRIRNVVTQLSIDRSQMQARQLERLQGEGLALLSTDPAWSVYVEKLKEASAQFDSLTKEIENKLTDVRRAITPELFTELRTSLAYARGYLMAVDMALELVVQSQLKKEDK